MRSSLPRRTAFAGILAACALAPAAHATQGYFQPGYDAVQKALASAGAANPETAMTIANNPAGLTTLGETAEFGMSLFMPFRGYTATGGTGFVAPGHVTSGWNAFAMPNAAFSQPLDAHSAWGIALYGNGGMNTLYPADVANAACGGGSGVYCAGKAGVNLGQIFISPAYARQFGSVSLGIAPILAIQYFDAEGLAAFSAISSSPGDLTNRGMSYSYGGGLRLGALWSVTPTIRLGLDGSTPVWMTKFSKYQGLFADGGSFDIPASLSAGIAWDVLPTLTLMADYRHIFYSDIASIGTPSLYQGVNFGSANAPGFGWHDVDVEAIAAEWRVTPALTLRAGYAHNTNPISSKDVTLNILAPGVVTNELSGGGSYKFGDHSVVDASLLYVPTTTVTGQEVTPGGAIPGHYIKLAMHQWDLTLEYRYIF
jgi:long-chain fatty acid transport protein